MLEDLLSSDSMPKPQVGSETGPSRPEHAEAVEEEESAPPVALRSVEEALRKRLYSGVREIAELEAKNERRRRFLHELLRYMNATDRSEWKNIPSLKKLYEEAPEEQHIAPHSIAISHRGEVLSSDGFAYEFAMCYYGPSAAQCEQELYKLAESLFRDSLETAQWHCFAGHRWIEHQSCKVEFRRNSTADSIVSNRVHFDRERTFRTFSENTLQ